MEKSRRNFIKFILVQFVLLFFCMGCGKTVEEEPVVMVDNSEDVSVYTLVECTRNDVALTKKISVEYRQASQQEVALQSGGKRIEKVLVREGDEVKKGDVLLITETDNLDERIENLRYQIECEKLKLNNLDAAEKFALNNTYYGYVYGSGLVSEDDLKAYEKSEELVKRDYQYQREDLQDQIEFDTKELQKLQAELHDSKVYAELDGIVYKIEKKLKGSMTKKDQVIMTIVDASQGYFVTGDPIIKEQLQADSILEMNVGYGKAAGDYEILAEQYSQWTDEEQLFSVLSEPDGAVIEVGTIGTIEVTLEERKQVLSIPSICVYEADGEHYVYVLNESGMKEVKFVTIGLVGNTLTEITSGLTEGEQIVRK